MSSTRTGDIPQIFIRDNIQWIRKDLKLGNYKNSPAGENFSVHEFQSAIIALDKMENKTDDDYDRIKWVDRLIQIWRTDQILEQKRC